MSEIPLLPEITPVTTPVHDDHSLDLPDNAPVPVSSNFKQTDQFSYPWPDKPPKGLETAFLPSGTLEDAKRAMADTPKSPLGENKATLDWVSALNSGLGHLPYAGGLNGTVEREDACFMQSVPSETGAQGGIYPAFKAKPGVKYTGEPARLRIRSALNLGTVFSVPLWHSGFWVTIKAPSEGALLELFRRIDSDKVTLGRATYGLLFSNGASYIAKILLDFVMDNLYETSLKLADGEDLRDFIRVPDLSLLIWGTACAIWPAGFPYQRSCIADPDKCKHVLEEKLNLSKLLWTDTSALTQRQIAHMTRRQRGSVDTTEVARYVSEFIRGQERKVKLTEELSVIMCIPTVVEHIDSGYRWINGLEENYGNSMAQPEKSRDDYLISQGKASIMRQYAHFVKAIQVGDDVYDERSDVEDALNDLTANDTIRNTFLTKASEYLDDSVISLVAVPTYKCPACGKDQTPSKKSSHHTGLIPLDVNQTFFTLLVQKLRRIDER